MMISIYIRRLRGQLCGLKIEKQKRERANIPTYVRGILILVVSRTVLRTVRTNVTVVWTQLNI